MSPFVQSVAVPASTPLAQRIAKLPIDAQTNLAGYLESGLYDLWKNFNTHTLAVAFADQGQSLVSVALKPNPHKQHEKVLVVDTRNMTSGELIGFVVPGKVKTARLSEDGKKAAILLENGTIQIWNTETGILVLVMDQVMKNLFGFSLDGTMLVVQDFNNKIKFFNLLTNQIISLQHNPSFESNSNQISSHMFELNKRMHISFWDTANGRYMPLQGRLAIYQNTNVLNFKFTDNGKTFAIAAKTNLPDGSVVFQATLCEYNLENILIPKALLNFTVPVLIKHLSDDATLLALSVGNKLLLFNPKTGVFLQCIDYDVRLSEIIFSPDNEMLVIINGIDGMQIWKKSTALQDTLVKQQKIQERKSQGVGQSSSSSSSGSGSSPSSSSGYSSSSSFPSSM